MTLYTECGGFTRARLGRGGLVVGMEEDGGPGGGANGGRRDGAGQVTDDHRYGDAGTMDAWGAPSGNRNAWVDGMYAARVIRVSA